MYASQAIWNPNQGGESTWFYVGGWWGPVQRQGVRGKEVDGGQQRGLMWCQAVGLQLSLLSGEGNKSRNGRNSTFVIVLLMACWIWRNCTGNPIPLTHKLTDLIDCFKKDYFSLLCKGVLPTCMSIQYPRRPDEGWSPWGLPCGCSAGAASALNSQATSRALFSCLFRNSCSI